MKELTIFILRYCPHCKKAISYIEELIKENPEYQTIAITYIDEKEQPQIANAFDYYYVPCFYRGNEKIKEGIVTKKDVKEILDIVMKDV